MNNSDKYTAPFFTECLLSKYTKWNPFWYHITAFAIDSKILNAPNADADSTLCYYGSWLQRMLINNSPRMFLEFIKDTPA